MGSQPGVFSNCAKCAAIQLRVRDGSVLRIHQVLINKMLVLSLKVHRLLASFVSRLQLLTGGRLSLTVERRPGQPVPPLHRKTHSHSTWTLHVQNNINYLWDGLFNPSHFRDGFDQKYWTWWWKRVGNSKLPQTCLTVAEELSSNSKI